MPMYYDENGELRYTDDRQTAIREQSRTMLTAEDYGLAPEAVADLEAALGPTPDASMTEIEARRRVNRALASMGLDVPVEVAVEALGEEWELLVKTGSAATG